MLARAPAHDFDRLGQQTGVAAGHFLHVLGFGSGVDKRTHAVPAVLQGLNSGVLSQMVSFICGQVFVAPEPEGVGPEKFDEAAGAFDAQLKYGSGMPFARCAYACWLKCCGG